MKKTLSLLVILSIILSSGVSFATPSNWAIQEVAEAKELSIVPENLLNNYQENITREEFSELVINLYESLSNKIAIPSPINTFKDTTSSKILKAHKLGIVEGRGDGIFAPSESITREEIAVMYFRMIEAIDNRVIIEDSKLSFADNNMISIWAKDAVNFMSNKTIIKGMNNNTFNPKGTTTREQAIALTLRTYKGFPSLYVSSNQGKLTPVEIGEMSNSIVQIIIKYDNGDTGYGSGFFFEKGKLATNFHVIEGAVSIILEYEDGTKYNGDIKVVGFDRELDIAVLSINDQKTEPLLLGNSDILVKGQKVYAIGSPIGFKNSLTDGLISAIRPDIIQVTTAINAGSSGGALIDEFGKVIGITYAKLIGADNIGFAIPINQLKALDKSKDLSLVDFNKSISTGVKAPQNVMAVADSSTSILLSWDKTTADYYTIYESLDYGKTWLPLVNENGENRWDWHSDYSVEISDYEVGSTVYYAVASVKGNNTSEYGYSNSITLFDGMTEQEIFDDLVANVRNINVENINVAFEGFDVTRTIDGKTTKIFAYVNEDEFQEFIGIEESNILKIAKELKNISLHYATIIGTDVEMVIVYSGFYDEYPSFLEENDINPDEVIEYDPLVKLWYAWFPLLNVANKSNVYLTWYGAYNF
ncbi:MAG: trypsin-like peptidase domain-containing protein [Gudongella sp.]|nr:trypsin-like peptidase domain-containing protein [Gudongella sp.]